MANNDKVEMKVSRPSLCRIFYISSIKSGKVVETILTIFMYDNFIRMLKLEGKVHFKTFFADSDAEYLVVT